MASDTRDESNSNGPPPTEPPPGSTSSPLHIQSSSPKIYEVFNAPASPPTSDPLQAPQSANALPDGSGQNTAGSGKEAPTLVSAIKTVRVQDFKQVHMYPCVRESLLMGIGGAFGMGGVRALWGAPIPKAANWAVGTFVFASFANYEFCLYRRRLERQHMKRAVEIIDRKKVEKEALAKAKREERRRAKEEEDRRKEEEAKRGWWRVW
ncbi:related to COX20 In the maturation and assembly of cytochrome oxidase involved protein [Rhynchosporium agropyri]|uniref:Cytochrome c oxidase assembly protein COX20, mitochondrial n=1 Tax=Rhynchosporium agropyri TaxID=914238 RepID=A0A1E1KB41_9HELO|nr:related to COX20 In the maturation and assembly of cytochrome oxidase involved protein [Rhynchosporium agropyri]